MEALRGEMTVPMSHTSMQPLTAETLVPNDATLLLRGPRRNRELQKGECHGRVGKAAGEGEAHCTTGTSMSPAPAPGNTVGCLSLTPNRSKRGADTFPCHQSTNQTSFHNSVTIAKIKMPVQQELPLQGCIRMGNAQE